jgi:hypothetical protein
MAAVCIVEFRSIIPRHNSKRSGADWPRSLSSNALEHAKPSPILSRQYYISSLLTCAQGFARLVQGHWAIENRLHWVKDISLHEDQAPYTDKRAAANWSIVRTFFITLARRLGFTSIATAKRRLANQFEHVFLSLQ